MRSGYNPLNYYPPNRVPYEALNHGSLSSLRPNGGFEDLANHMVDYHNSKGRNVSKEQVKEHLLAHTRKMGLSDAQGAGFWSDLWTGIKNTAGNVARNVASNVGQAVSNEWQKFKENPVDTINKIVETVQPFLKAGETAAAV